MQIEHNYFQEIEQTFSRCRGRGVLVSPRDWQLMETWEQKQIPLHIVTGTIRDVFKQKTQVTSLAYCAPAVEERFKHWQDSQVGKYTEPDHEPSCSECHDTKEIFIPAANPLFSFQMESVPCPKCVPSVT